MASKFRLVLPVIPAPEPGTASVLIGDPNLPGPFFRGAGDTDLLCGSCKRVLAEAMGAGQIRSLVLKCPKCEQHNAIVEIPKLEAFVAQLQAAGVSLEKVPTFKKLLTKAIEERASADQIAEQVQDELPEFSWFKDMLVPTSPGELYAFLSFVVALLAWWQTMARRRNEKPSVVVNNFFGATDPFKDVGRNEPCPCGSGLKFKKCHAAPTQAQQNAARDRVKKRGA